MINDLRNKKFGRLTALVPTSKRQGGAIIWQCKCECGNIHEARSTHLIGKDIRSCGCLLKDTITTHGDSRNNKRTKLYTLWKEMRRRCHTPRSSSFSNYGAKGIKVFPEWYSSYQTFKSYIKATIGLPKVIDSIDRIDPKGDYVPGNIRWASRSEQCMNRLKYITARTSSKYKGVHFCKDKKINPWRAAIRANLKRTHLGYFKTEKEAALAYNQAAILHHKEFASLNVIEQ